MSQFTDFQYDVFLSHNQADKPRVRRLAERLRAANLRVWFPECIQSGGRHSPDRNAPSWAVSVRSKQEGHG